MAKVISGFPAVGKSYLFSLDTDLVILDSDSSNFSWVSEGVRDSNFPVNYMEHILNNMDKADIILVSSHKIVRDALKDHDISYTIVYPEIELKNEYMERYKERGSSEGFIKFINSNWEQFIQEIEEEQYPTKMKLGPKQFLKDVFTECL